MTEAKNPNMKEATVKDLNNDHSAFEKFSIKAIMRTYDYRFRYIYTEYGRQ